MALIENRPLLYFNRVKIFDILLARGILEANQLRRCFLLFWSCLLAVYSTDFSPRDWPGMVFAVAATIYFGFSFGVANALIARLLPIWYIFFNLSMPVFWMASGIFFFPTAIIPDPYDRCACLEPLAAKPRVDSLCLLRGLSGQASQYSLSHHLCDYVSCRELGRREACPACVAYELSSGITNISSTQMK